MRPCLPKNRISDERRIGRQGQEAGPREFSSTTNANSSGAGPAR